MESEKKNTGASYHWKNPTHFLRSNSRCCSYLRICWKTLCAWSLPHFWNFHTNENIAYMKMLISRNNIMNSISIDQIFSMDSLSSGQRNSANDTNTHTRSRWAQKKHITRCAFYFWSSMQSAGEPNNELSMSIGCCLLYCIILIEFQFIFQPEIWFIAMVYR